MHETMVKTHLIITDIHEEYNMKWCGSILDTNPKLENGKPVFVIRSKLGAIEINTIDMKELEKTARSMTEPKGRAGVTSDIATIYIKEIGGGEKALGILTHYHIKQYAPMYDKVYYR